MLKTLVPKLAGLLNEIKGKKAEIELIKKQILQIMKEEDVNPLVSKEYKLVLSREVRTKSVWNYSMVIDVLFQLSKKHNFPFDVKKIMKFDDSKIKELVKKYPELKKFEKAEVGDEHLVVRELKEKEK